ncbi:hypothetical protein RF11_06745 [Thelohanellus kitauei]|uniref:Uncharacterized protein n=1 Tax=Thelohanellus kitauei TaxID=669202 RepID=A0A0C2JGF3_THEKT|nr:hypothetical protein RF11_06745 [Thelohanellus kitauei]
MIMFFRGINAKDGTSKETNEKDVITPAEDIYPISKSNIRYLSWVPAEQWDYRMLHYLLDKNTKQKKVIRYEITRVAYGIEDGDVFVLYEIERPDNKFCYPMFYIDTKPGSKFKLYQLARVLNKKPFENKP